MDKPCILIIDDDPGLRKTLTDILTFKGYATALKRRKDTGKRFRSSCCLYRAKANGRNRVAVGDVSQ